MDNEKIGFFIAEQRKKKKLTQRDLADKLNVTDKAVSKWERGLSLPDISLLPRLAEIFEISIAELLNGETGKSDPVKVDGVVKTTLLYADKTEKLKIRNIRNIFLFSISVLFLSGIITCAICDMAITGSFTWSLYCFSSIIFAWIIIVPLVRYGWRGVLPSLIALSVFIIPYIYILDSIMKTNEFLLPMGVRISVVSVIYLWIVYVLFTIIKTNKLLAAVFSILLIIPLDILINIVVVNIIGGVYFEVWDIISYSVILVAAIFVFFIACRRKSRK